MPRKVEKYLVLFLRLVSEFWRQENSVNKFEFLKEVWILRKECDYSQNEMKIWIRSNFREEKTIQRLKSSVWNSFPHNSEEKPPITSSTEVELIGMSRSSLTETFQALNVHTTVSFITAEDISSTEGCKWLRIYSGPYGLHYFHSMPLYTFSWLNISENLHQIYPMTAVSLSFRNWWCIPIH